MANKNVQYNLNFTANTTSAKAALQELFKSLDAVGKANLDMSYLDADLQKGAEAARTLKSHLEAAVNVNTGKLNLNELEASLKASGTSLSQLSTTLLGCGKTGEKAFSTIVSAIAKTEVPLKRTNGLLHDFAITMKNTVKWQLSSNIVHGLESALSNAVGYAKDLNTALTDIRIVTGKSVEDMSNFAVAANRAAKELKTSTTEYAKASLIYFQQGDSDEIVQQKTNITMKAANASTESTVSEMSDYLTAVWNSYQVANDQLEATVDIMAALGAKTATSMEEIAAAMQKVASVGNSVGVNFEQLSSIISTVSSVTRQSAESIGTSFKTILARLGDLKLGKTDEDGVGLGTVSSQLDAMGIQILDASGELRDMGTVIEEIGEKWQTMNRATQTALAQALAGKRQYTQLVALFDNWDMYQENMAIAEDSEGALQNMQDVYTDSWKAAAKEVQASWEEIYNKLIKSEHIITLFKGMAGALGLVSGAIEGLGGLPGILMQIGNIGMRAFKDQIGASIQSVIDKTKDLDGKVNMKDIFANFFNIGKNSEQEQFLKNIDALQSSITDARDNLLATGKSEESWEIKELDSAADLLQAKQQLVNVSKQMSDGEKTHYSQVVNQLSSELDMVKQLNREYETRYKDMKENSGKNFAKDLIAEESRRTDTSEVEAQTKLQNSLRTSAEEARKLAIALKLDPDDLNLEIIGTEFANLNNKLNELGMADEILNNLKTSIAMVENPTEACAVAMQKLKTVLTDAGFQNDFISKIEQKLKTGNIDEAIAAISIEFNELKGNADNARLALEGIFGKEVAAAAMQKMQENVNGVAEAHYRAAGAANEHSASTKKLIKDLDNINKSAGRKIANVLQQGVSVATSAISSFMGAANAVKTLGDEAESVTNKIGAVGGVITDVIMAFATGGPIAGAIALIGTAIGAVVGHAEQMQKELKEAQELTIEANNKVNDKIKAEAESNEELLVSFNDLLEKKRMGMSVDEELAETAEKLSEAYDLTGAAIARLTGNYQGLIAEMRNLGLAQAQEQVKQAQQAKDIAGAALQSAASGKTHSSLGTIKSSKIIQPEYVSSISKESARANDALNQIQGIYEKFSLQYGEAAIEEQQAFLEKIGLTEFPTFEDFLINFFEGNAVDNFDPTKMFDENTGELIMASFISILKDTNLFGFNDDSHDSGVYLVNQMTDSWNEAFVESIGWEGNAHWDNPSTQVNWVGNRDNGIQAASIANYLDSIGYGGIDYDGSGAGLMFEYYKTGVKSEDYRKERTLDAKYKDLDYVKENYGETVSFEEIVKRAGAEKFFASTYGDPNAQILMSEDDSTEYRKNLYEGLNAVYEEMSKLGLSNTDFAKKIHSLLEELQPAYDSLMEAEANLAKMNDQALASSVLGYTTNKEDTENYLDFSTYQEKEKAIKAELRKIYSNDLAGMDAKEQEKMIDEKYKGIASLNEAMYSYYLTHQAFLEKFPTYTEKQAEKFSELLNKYGPEIFKSENLWTRLMNAETANWESIVQDEKTITEKEEKATTQNDVYDKVTSAKSKLKEDMTNEELEELRNVADWSNDFGISFTDFLNKTYDEQVQFLDTVGNNALTKLAEELTLIQAAEGKVADEFATFSEISTQNLTKNADSTYGSFDFDGDEQLDGGISENFYQIFKDVENLFNEASVATNVTEKYAKQLQAVNKLLQFDDATLKAMGYDPEKLKAWQSALTDVVNTGDDLAVANYRLTTSAEAAAKALEEIVGISRKDSDAEFTLTEKQEANEVAAEHFDAGRSYEELDQWTKHWLEEQYGSMAQSVGKTVEEYLQTQTGGAGEYLRNQNTNLANEQGNLYQNQYDILSQLVTKSLEDGTWAADKQAYQIKADDITFNDAFSKEEFLSAEGVTSEKVLENGQEVEYINIAPEAMDEIRQMTEAAADKMSASSDIEYENLQASLNTDSAQQEAITGILDASTMEEMATAATALREAYAGADAETQKWVESLIAARKAGEDGAEANEYLTSQHLRSVKDLRKMTKAQRDQYKEMLRVNNVTVKGHKTLDSYFDALDKSIKVIDEVEQHFEDFDPEDYSDKMKEISDGTEDTADIIQDVLPTSLQYASDELSTISQTLGEGGTIFDALSGWLQDDGTFTQSINDVLSIMGAGADQIAAAQASVQAQVEANGSIGAVDWLQVFADANVDPSQFDSIITALNAAMASIQAALAANGIQLDPPWTPIDTLSAMGVGRGGGSASGGKTPNSGGKGGGGGSKQKTKEDKLRAEDEIERYHEQNEVLDRVGEKLEAIDKLKDRTYGKNHLAQLDAETEALKEQLAAQADLYNEANKWRASDQKELISLGVGVEFDEDGNISNYEEVMQALLDDYNADVERYNNSDQDEGDKLRLDADKQAYEDAVQAIEDYEESLRTGNEALIEMEEIRNQISELELEKITYKLEVETELNENDLELLEYYTDKWEDDLDKQADRFVKVTDSITVYQDNLTNLNNALNELNEQHQNGTINEADYAEGMQDIRDQIMENLENLEDAGDQLKEIYSDALELAREEIDKTTEAIQHSSDVMESYISIMGLMGKANDFESLQSFYDAQYTYGIQQVGVLKSTYDTLIAARAEYDAKIEAGQELSEVEQANYDALQEQIRETEEEMLSATEATLEAIQAGYQNAVQAMSKDLEEFMVGTGNSIAGLADQYAYFQEKQDRYVSTAKELFEVSKLNREIENSLADATTDASKEALKALQEKINKQSELNELTEYDIQMNQLEYQLLLARIQLEEASSSKDTVRLTRDENGNYAYQYTADQDKVNEAMQQYEDVLQQINELSVERTGEIEQQMIDAMQNNLAKFNEIMTDETLSTEERNQKIADLNTQFSETMLYLQEQAGIAGENLTWNQEMIAEHFGVSLSDITASTAGNVNDSVQAMIDRADEFAAKMNAVLTGDGEGSVSGVWAEYQNRLDQVSQTSGLNYDTMTDKISDFTHANDLAAGKANEVLDVLEDTLAPLTALTAAWGVHANMIESMVEYYEALADAMNDAMRDSANTGGAPVGTGGTPASTGFEDKGYGPYEVTMPDGTKVTHNATGPWSALAMAGVPYSQVANVNVVPKFLKGGLVDFTGLAQLDGTQTDPELVLNADDTRNLLETVRMVRQLDANTLSLLVSSLETSVNSMMAFMGSSYHAFGVSGMQSQTLDQNVQITAEFPNVTDHNEIEEAFNSLVNRAAQFAKQK